MAHRHLCTIGVAVVFSGVLAVTLLTGSSAKDSAGESAPVTRVASSLTASESTALQWSSTATLSCAGRNCHGAATPSPTRAISQNEFLIWSAVDPHARAFEVLKSPEARQIARNLFGTKDDGSNEPVHEAAHAQRCLACHTSSRPHDGQFVWSRYGVGCESCHGQPDRWLHEHYSWFNSWTKQDHVNRKDDKFQVYENNKMTWLGTATARAGVCVGCHVGAPGTETAPLRDVIHDLYAAGHPLMHFELNEYLRALPRHWAEPPDPLRQVRTWAAGQWSAARAWVRLLEDRANRAALNDDPHQATGGDASTNVRHPWPELSEMNCNGCHHDLKVDHWPYNDADAKLGLAGATTWGNDYTQHLDAVAALAGFTDHADLPPTRQALEELRSDVRSWSAKADDIGKAAHELTTQLDGFAVDKSLEAIRSTDVEIAIQIVLDEIESIHPRDRDKLIQHYLALLALKTGLQQPSSGTEARLNNLAHGLPHNDPLKDVHDFYQSLIREPD